MIKKHLFYVIFATFCIRADYPSAARPPGSIPRTNPDYCHFEAFLLLYLTTSYGKLSESHHHLPLRNETMSNYYALPQLIIAITSVVAAYTTLGTSLTCVPGSPVSAAPSCDFFLESINTCAALTDRQSQRACLCIQNIFNAATE